MNINDLINKLNQIKKQYGNLKVFCFKNDESYQLVDDVSFINYDKDFQIIFSVDGFDAIGICVD